MINDRTANMDIFVTGATGFVGQALTLKLLENGNHVKALVRSSQKAEELGLKHERLTLIQGNLDNKTELTDAMDGCSQVFHLAALAGVWAPGNQFHEVNVEGTRHVMDAAVLTEVDKVVMTSTAAVIGPALEGPVNENTKRKIPYLNEYERTKAEANALAFSYQEKGLSIVVTVPTRVFGPGPLNSSNSPTKIMQQYMLRNLYFRPGNGESTGNYVYLPDLVDGHIKAMEKGRSGEMYLMGGEDLSWNEIMELLGELKGKRLLLISLPMGVILAFAALQQFGAEKFGRPPLITPEWVRKFSYNWKVSSQKAQDELGYKITPFREAMAETVDWLMATHQEKKPQLERTF